MLKRLFTALLLTLFTVSAFPAQHDYVISNAPAATVRADINTALLAIASENSGATEPATRYAYMLWADTTTGILKQRNAANSAWISLFTMSTGVPVNGNVGTVTSVTSANADITVATTTSTPVLTLVQAPALRSATTTVNVSSATAPTTGQILRATGASAATWQSGGILLTPQATTSGTSWDFTIPTWATEITLHISGFSTNGTSNYMVQIGDSGGIETTGYLGSVGGGAAATAATAFTTGYGLASGVSAASVVHGQAILKLMDSSANTWTFSSNLGYSNTGTFQVGAGAKSLSAVITTVRLTTVNGTDAGDAGAVNASYR